ncbi:phage antirepressor KilAC domain-containing protein [Maridesulfovibrio bastinii]|uniref:phage antirepressor KilAC domain-containing protein n=1 Tax=Maridesulfovibrio bastinii TaxID=47157 RepID=UPI001B7FEA7A|nr:phage antirepressor KilAC domain-containing protein [Maridesulfovibrio bastinii]
MRTFLNDGELYFAGKDVATSLGYKNTADAIGKHCKASTTIAKRDGGFLTIIPERDVYRLIMRSKLPAAEKFEEWVVGEVLPSIRKHNAYMTPDKLEEVLLNPDILIQLATSLKDEQERRRNAEMKIEADRLKVVFAESIEVSETTILIGELAKLIKQSTQYDIGQKRLFAWMRKNGYLIKGGSEYNMPTQLSMNLGLFVIKEGTRAGTKGTHITKTTKVTGKGQLYFIKKFHDKMNAKRNAASSLEGYKNCQEVA